MTQIAVNGQLWRYEVYRGKGTPVVILHGWGRSGSEWLEIGRELNIWSGRSVYIVDLPGFGGSSLNKVMTIEQYAQSVVGFCEYLGIHKIILIGHSLGGRVGIVLGAKCLSLIEKLILVDPAGVKPRSLKRVGLKLIASVFRWIPLHIRNIVVTKLMDEDYINAPLLRDLYRAVVSQDLRKYLPLISCITVVLWGEHDPILPLSQSKLYRELIPKSQVHVVWGSGHDPHLDNFDQTLKLLQEAVE